jgi:hypothetical protein
MIAVGIGAGKGVTHVLGSINANNGRHESNRRPRGRLP